MNGNPDTSLDPKQLRDVAFDDQNLMREVLNALVDDTSRQMTLLDSAIRDEDATRCMHLAHYSKGACANLGANGAATLLKNIERQAGNRDFERCRLALAQLAKEVELLRIAALSL